jgi:hypothetical protein
MVQQREGGRCALCVGGRGVDWHHRRSRRVRADHRHCACNGLLLCRTCHSWAHANPDEAQAVGSVVSQWVDEPFLVPLHTALGWWQLRCDGAYDPLTEADVVTDGMGGYRISRPVGHTGQTGGPNEGHTVE